MASAYETAARNAGWQSDPAERSRGEWHIFLPTASDDSRAVQSREGWRLYVESWEEACAESDLTVIYCGD